ncbi:putative Integral membrane protein [Streptomyces viridochromogenes Tue57]|uniref:Putative Integral membrane protein n=1 Tax=Streptomyces viridochromogenes Tue57 TaxID=1160705 RepID=L8PIK8_STRVR|nr:putative Integral membrane protein [Streptomyces viridochromogenes Tue57]
MDPLEIAAGLEAHGVTDRTAARFLHRDVFSLAEEMYARVPRDAETPSGRPPFTAPRARADWALLTLLPGALCAAAVTGLHLTHGHSRLMVAAAGCLAVALALRAAVARGPLAVTDRTRPPVARTCWLIAYALLGDGLLNAAATGGPDALPTGTTDGPWPLATTPVLVLALSCAPAAWCAHLLAVRARRKLSASRALEDFATSARPLLLGTFTLYLCVLTALLTLTATALNEPAAYPQTLTLGALLLLSRLLTTHGFTHAPALVLTATATAEATALCSLFASRLPGCAWLATPVQALIDTWGPGSIPTAACGAGALTLLLHATRTLTRASAYARQDQPW